MSAYSMRERANVLCDQLAANGAIFSFKPAENALPAGFTYSLPKGGDRWKCRGLVAEAKADATLWSAVVTEIGRRNAGGVDAA